jgi:hypothetical protein
MTKPYRFHRRMVERRTADEFHAWYKGHHVSINREAGAKQWYIQVTAPNGDYTYDGWWGECGSTIDDAIEQALWGSGLLKWQLIRKLESDK